nr:unnamed protein product [Spirometra erinaceieuropaei]
MRFEFLSMSVDFAPTNNALNDAGFPSKKPLIPNYLSKKLEAEKQLHSPRLPQSKTMNHCSKASETHEKSPKVFTRHYDGWVRTNYKKRQPDNSVSLTIS